MRIILGFSALALAAYLCRGYFIGTGYSLPPNTNAPNTNVTINVQPYGLGPVDFIPISYDFTVVNTGELNKSLEEIYKLIEEQLCGGKDGPFSFKVERKFSLNGILRPLSLPYDKQKKCGLVDGVLFIYGDDLNKYMKTYENLFGSERW